jgi:hypothetical protein
MGHRNALDCLGKMKEAQAQAHIVWAPPDAAD